jgi:hypothetical protein
MWPPDLPTAAPSYWELFAEGCFGQRSLFSGEKLREAAINRGLGLPLFPRHDCLEPLDRAGGFSPIGFLQTSFTPETTWLNPDPQLMIWREERHFQAWDHHGWYLRHERHINVNERYSPWQLLYLADALDAWDRRISLRRLEPLIEDPAEFLALQRSAAAARLDPRRGVAPRPEVARGVATAALALPTREDNASPRAWRPRPRRSAATSSGDL